MGTNKRISGKKKSMNANNFRRILLVLFVALLFQGCLKSGYVIDSKQKSVVWKTYRVGEAKILKLDMVDFDSFKILHYERIGKRDLFAKDSNLVYFQGRVVESADPNTFRKVNSEYYLDAHFVYRYVPHSISKIVEADPMTFEILNSKGWARDKQKVFLGDLQFKPDDIETFEVLDIGYWSRDQFSYYFGTRRVVPLHYDTFQILDDPNHFFSKDNQVVYWQGCIIEGLNSKSFEFEDSSSGTDGKYNYLIHLKSGYDISLEDFCIRVRVQKSSREN